MENEECFPVPKMTGETWFPGTLFTALAPILHNVCLEKGLCTYIPAAELD